MLKELVRQVASCSAGRFDKLIMYPPVGDYQKGDNE